MTQIQTTEAPPETNMLAIIDAAVKSKDVDVAKMRELFELQKDFMKQKAQQAFAAAMTACQMEIAPIFRDSQNPSNKSKYAKYEKVDAAIRPIYTRHGFSLSFGSAAPSLPGNIKVTCVCRHSMGHEEHYELESGVDDVGIKGEKNKTAIQGSGSSVSYIRRYLTGMIFNVVYTNEDNDGQNTAKTFISEAKRDIILQALDRNGKTADQLCRAMKIESLADIEDRHFDAVIARINAPKESAGA